MDIKSFSNPNGSFIKTTMGCDAFVVNALPPIIRYDDATLTLAMEAHTKLGNLAGIGETLPNPNLLIMPYIRLEAMLSSKIEGTQASMVDILQYEAGDKTDSKDDERKRTHEVINYISSLKSCLADLKDSKVDLAMIKKAHRILMNDVYVQENTPGKFRTIQNWIGYIGSGIRDATFVPVPPDGLEKKMYELESFMDKPPVGMSVLIQCALIHYQFESIHPFSDGNGRVGRMLIPLILAERKLLIRPLLYLSAYFEENRKEYYHHLRSISKDQSWIPWIRFFLKGIIKQSDVAIHSIQKLKKLQSSYEVTLRRNHASGNSVQLMNHLFAIPIITIPNVAQFLGVTYPTAKYAIENLQKIGIVKEHGKRKRNKMYAADEILDVLS